MDLLRNKKTILPTERVGVEQQQFLFSMPLVNSTLLPKGIHLEDIDKGFLEYVQNELEVIVNGKKVDAVLLSTQKFSEYIKTWENTDEKTKTVSLPIITIVRKPIAKQGTSFDKVSFNIPYESQYTIYRIPKVINGTKSYEHYQIPQPINVDLEYEINFFATRQRDINKLNETMLKEYKSSQRYISVDGHHMGTYLTGIEDDTKTDISARRFYNSKYQILTKGYLLDENDFKIVSFLDKMILIPEFESEVVPCESISFTEFGDCNFCITFKIPRKSEILTKEYQIPLNLSINSHNKVSLSGIALLKNDVPVTIPFEVTKGDMLKIIIDSTLIEKKALNFSICGYKND